MKSVKDYNKAKINDTIDNFKSNLLRRYSFYGWDQLSNLLRMDREEVVELWNETMSRKHKVFTKTNIWDYIELTNETWSDRPVYKFIKEYTFYPNQFGLPQVIPIGFKFDFMSVPTAKWSTVRGAKWYLKPYYFVKWIMGSLIRSNELWGMYGALEHDYHFETRSVFFPMSALRFYKNNLSFAPLSFKPYRTRTMRALNVVWVYLQITVAFIMVGTFGYFAWIKRSKEETNRMLAYHKANGLRYLRDTGGIDETIDRLDKYARGE